MSTLCTPDLPLLPLGHLEPESWHRTSLIWSENGVAISLCINSVVKIHFFQIKIKIKRSSIFYSLAPLDHLEQLLEYSHPALMISEYDGYFHVST